jgi:hypothetical protein
MVTARSLYLWSHRLARLWLMPQSQGTSPVFLLSCPITQGPWKLLPTLQQKVGFLITKRLISAVALGSDHGGGRSAQAIAVFRGTCGQGD